MVEVRCRRSRRRGSNARSLGEVLKGDIRPLRSGRGAGRIGWYYACRRVGAKSPQCECKWSTNSLPPRPSASTTAHAQAAPSRVLT